MTGIEAIEQYQTELPQECRDREVILKWMRKDPELIFTREHELAHMTASSMIFNENKDKVLMAYHNIYKSWAWTGGHMDGDHDYLYVAKKEAREETGIENLTLIHDEIIALDILTVESHWKRGVFINSHLHLNVTYGFIASENQPIHCKEDENSKVAWIPYSKLDEYVTEPIMLPVYHKILERMKG